MTNNATPPTMNITEAADTLKIHPHSLEKIIRAGDIPAGRVGRAYVLMTRDVLAYAGIITLLKINNLKIIPTKATNHDSSIAAIGLDHSLRWLCLSAVYGILALPRKRWSVITPVTSGKPHPERQRLFCDPVFNSLEFDGVEFWPGGRRIQHPQGKEVRQACYWFLTSRPPRV